MNGSLNGLYRLLGISKQAVHTYDQRQRVFDNKLMDLMVEVDELRSQHPGCGVEKMYYTLKPDFIGRDRFIEHFMELGYRVRRIRNYHRTTIPASHKYPNLIEGILVKSKNTVWQSDITYFDIGGRFYYLVFIIDVYTRQIVGYAVSDHLRAEANLKALKMAIKSHGAPKIHHSDRGSQYIDKRYVKLLTDNGVDVSMGLQAQDNAYAERINGTIKNDYLKHWKIKSFNELKNKVKQAVEHYNSKRIHDSLPNRCTPNVFEELMEKYPMVEEIYAPNRPIPSDKTFEWSEEIKENELFCVLY
jgi:transposase InsO family protein